jgi:O-antigen ligase
LTRSAEETHAVHHRAGWGLLALLLAAFLLGGGSRADITSLIVLRPLSAMALVGGLALVWRRGIGEFAAPLGVLGGWFILTALQLVPLPPSLWTALPGREALAASYAVLDIAPGWKPLTVDPMATLNSMMALFVPLAALMFYAAADDSGRRRALMAFVALAGISALLGVAQVIGGHAALYPYRVTNEGFPIGLFANRNHQAAILAAAIPMLIALTARRGTGGNVSVVRWGGWFAAIALAAVAVMTGSRMGSILALAGLLGASLMFAERRGTNSSGPSGAIRGLQRIAIPAILLLGVAAMFLVSTGTGFERMAEKDNMGDLRFQILPTVWHMIVSSFPVGFGFGSFAEAYKIYEPSNLMIAQYINRAHNDWIEIVLEGGIVAVSLALTMAGWLLKRCWRLRAVLLRPRDTRDQIRSAAAMGIVILAAASLFDYPLRTPAGAAVVSVLLACFASSRRRT